MPEIQTKFCIRCGAECDGDATFCHRCGAALSDGADTAAVLPEVETPVPAQASPVFADDGALPPEEGDWGAISVSDYATFTEKHSDHYLTSWGRLLKNPRALTWNWAAALFSVYWFFYRKMIRQGLFCILLMLVLSLVSATVSGFVCRELAQEVQALSAEAEQLEEQGAYTERLELSKQAMVLEDRLILRQLGVVLTFSVLSAVLIGVLADRIYLREARRRILDARMYNRYPDGGTSVGLALVGIPVVLVYNGIIEAVSDRILNALWGL